MGDGFCAKEEGWKEITDMIIKNNTALFALPHRVNIALLATYEYTGEHRVPCQVLEERHAPFSHSSTTAREIPQGIRIKKRRYLQFSL